MGACTNMGSMHANAGQLQGHMHGQLAANMCLPFLCMSTGTLGGCSRVWFAVQYTCTACMDAGIQMVEKPTCS